MIRKLNLDSISKILDNLEFQNKNIYLGIDFFPLMKLLKPKNMNYFEVTDEILKHFLRRIGKNGNLVVPVFNYDCIPDKKFHILKSSGQSGLLGNILLKKYSSLRTHHPLFSFLCFGNKFEKYKKIKNTNGTGKNSIWKHFIDDEFDLVTLGHNYSRSITHMHYIEDILNVVYRFNLKFLVKYTNRKNITSRKTFSFLARKRKICDFSGITKNCDKVFLKNGVSNFYKYKNFISFRLSIKEASNMWYSDVKNNSENLISYIRPNKPNKNLLCGYDGSITQLEKSYANSK